MGAIHRKTAFADLIAVKVAQGNFRYIQWAQFAAVVVLQFAVFTHHLMDKFVDKICLGAGVHPAGSFVESLIDKKLTPGRCAVGIESLLTDQVIFAPEKETGVRIDQQHGITTGAHIAIDRKSI